jgi:hypothetical protein
MGRRDDGEDWRREPCSLGSSGRGSDLEQADSGGASLTPLIEVLGPLSRRHLLRAVMPVYREGWQRSATKTRAAFLGTLAASEGRQPWFAGGFF